MVELASVLAEEDFSDRPRCVCPVIGAFLRGWNDRAPHAQRQRLGPYAARIVGSRDIPQVTRIRRGVCLEWAGADLTGGAARRLLSRAGMRFRIAVFCGLGAAVRFSEGAGDYASRVVSARGDTDSAFELLETLLNVGEHRPPDSPPVSANASARGLLNGKGPSAVGPPNHRQGRNGNGAVSNGGVPEQDQPSVRA